MGPVKDGATRLPDIHYQQNIEAQGGGRAKEAEGDR